MDYVFLAFCFPFLFPVTYLLYVEFYLCAWNRDVKGWNPSAVFAHFFILMYSVFKIRSNLML